MILTNGICLKIDFQMNIVISKFLILKSSLPLPKFFKHNKMIKKLFTILLFAGVCIFGTQIKAQDLKEIQQKKELFKVYTQLLDKNVELAKERQNNVQLTAIVNSLNKKSDKKTDKFTSSDPENTSTDARNTAKLLKQTESANRDLAKSNSKIKSLEAEVRKIVMKMEKFDYVIEIKNK